MAEQWVTKLLLPILIYDVVFKRLMEDTKNARFFIETLLDQEIEEIHFKFVATIKNTDGTRQKGAYRSPKK